MEVKRSIRTRGLTTMEILVASGISVLATFILADTTILATKTFQKIGEVATAENAGRRAFNTFTNDVEAASVSLAKFPAWSAAPWFTAEENTRVILQIPKFKADNTVDPGKFKVITYEAVAPANAADGPLVLKRWESSLTIGASTSSASKGTSTIVAKHIKSVKWNQMTSQLFWGDQYTKDYYLLSAPDADTNEIKLKVLVGGHNCLSDAKAVISGNKVTMHKPLVYGVAIDVTYHTDPSSVVNTNGSNGATGMFVKFVFNPKWTDGAGAIKSKEVTLSAMPIFENKVD